jgi:Fic family protein
MAKQPFSPPPLPPDIDLTGLIKLIADAREAVARYDEAVKRLPNPVLIRRTFETQEAVLSSKIEGTQATLEEVLEFDAEEANSEENEKLRDYREISNYRQAILYGKELLKARPLSENVIKELHKLLLNSVRGKNKTPGEFRRHQVHIGPAGATLEEASYVPPVHTEITGLISNLVNYLQDDKQPDRLVQAAIAHYQFEAIHPFADGNGRVGRLLIPLYFYEKGVTSQPNLYISEFLETHRRDYYEHLNRVSEEDDWLGWIAFFLRAVREQANLSKKRVERVEELYKGLHKRLPEFNSIYAPSFLEALFAQPVFTPQTIGKVANIPNVKTLYNLVDKFVQAKLIIDLAPQRARNKLYAFNELLEILETND